MRAYLARTDLRPIAASGRSLGGACVRAWTMRGQCAAKSFLSEN